MTDRLGPTDGYGKHGEKAQYRRNVWRTIATKLSPRIGDSHVLLMPSIEAHEIESALRVGFKEENLHIVDMNAAIVATVKRRYRLAHAYGRTIGEVGPEVVKRGIVLRAANLDLCANASRPMYEQVKSFAESGALQHGVVCVTMLRGRERPKDFQIINEASGGMCLDFLPEPPEPSARETNYSVSTLVGLNAKDWGRVLFVLRALMGLPYGVDVPRDIKHLTSVNYVYPHRAGIYRSTAGVQTMLWAAFAVHRAPCCCAFCVQTVASHVGAANSYGVHGESWLTSKQMAMGAMAHEWGISIAGLEELTQRRIDGQRVDEAKYICDPKVLFGELAEAGNRNYLAYKARA